MEVYLDNSSTTFPKPKQVINAMCDYMLNVGGNAGRGNYSNSLQSNRCLYDARELICNFFGYDSPSNVIFTNNVTTSLNILIKGILRHGDHVITSSMEHNSVIRPLFFCKENLQIELDIVAANSEGFINAHDLKKKITNKTRLVVMTQASNVTGSVQDLYNIGKICDENNIFFIVDSSQGAGVLDINMKNIKANAIAFTGHKSLLGPQGIGGFILDSKFNDSCSSLIHGGTGSLSYSLSQPDFLPDKFECGTHNLPGIVGLSESIKYINSVGLNSIYEHNNYLIKHMLEGLLNIKGITVYGDLSGKRLSSCISINLNSLDPSELGYYLECEGIKTRSGLHCSPLAHKTIGSYPSGTVRLSISYFTTKEEVNYALTVLNKIPKNL
ncbi:cysteine desulfurase [Clostridium beijerinckii]|jgi:cysteine desulfurase family protein|uniref:cysteine desulfurase n=1 Tax=Clostridium beijerinckii TaxID=1520 RepID=A0AB74VG24_CLOBE|nr:aminotransferase class V-fold PLP-dependent enzyme [Clostridium beijerinckii]MCI1478870.1 aminotransferase class V-fold PLP-dependent enzyme [Clostridium beijerinckii]MCI1580383.1 aminotransferase class V-fold PLP-dependent enzyme [Clostridium beijerinckii]MCI1583382.1 aminotransferase class V-fold PLP-dependent enzyme [Clostridium beijerinckii]MCI1624341.1 aminotransferase class V-fold PLP-dependent enzyme [Clostridium beijerinckii]NRZ24459.1 cysteine desulfurase family protein [Clostridiu